MPSSSDRGSLYAPVSPLHPNPNFDTYNHPKFTTQKKHCNAC